MSQPPSAKLSANTSIPSIGLGLWHVRDRKECIASIRYALEAGYRHFDTAQYYDNESFVGEALAASEVPRHELFLTTKIKNENQWWDDLIPSFEVSLKNLQTDYVDLLLLHFPVTDTRRPAWRKMEQIYRSGRAKAIGVSNYTIRHLEELLKECDEPPVVNQVEMHVFLQQPELLQYCRQQGIVVEAYSPLAHGEGHDDPVLAEIASKHHKSPAQIMIRWCLEVGTVPLPKSVHEDRIRANLDVFDFELDSADMTKLSALERNFRTCWDPTHVA